MKIGRIFNFIKNFFIYLSKNGLKKTFCLSMFYIKKIFNHKNTKVLKRKQCTVDNDIVCASKDYNISVVIPVYNGESDLKLLLPILKKQKYINPIEVVIVDSGSSDNSLKLAEKYGSKIIKIKNTEFSHSYARNLGAENTSGNILLFMTQDALPNDYYWALNLLSPIIKDDVVAVSCREIPKENCDLLGRASIYCHNKYMGILNTDRIAELPSSTDFNSLRLNGQLNDVSCMIKKDIFMSFKYRGDYAEDLDLGIRLIKNNYKIALLGNTCVIHSHTREAYYHFRRNIVDIMNLVKILPDFPIDGSKEQVMLERILTAYCCTSLLCCKLKKITTNTFENLKINLKNCYKECVTELNTQDINYYKNYLVKDDVFNQNLREVIINFSNRLNSFTTDFKLMEDLMYFIETITFEYIDYDNMLWDDKIVNQFIELLQKRYAVHAGNLLGSYLTFNRNDGFHNFIKNFAIGV